ncbi:MAG: PAS domain-containing protein, partial [Planctomycetaceae bacterium]
MTKTSLSFPLSVVLALLVFAIDVLVPIPGSAEPVLYLWSIWIAARTGDLRWTLFIASVVTLLATVAPLLSQTSEAWLLSIETDGMLAVPGVRAVVVMSIWGTVLAVLPLIKARRSLQQSQALLQAETVSQAEQLVQIRREKSAIELEAEQALRDSEALYHSLVEHLPLSVLRKDAQLRYTFVNRKFLEYSGLTLERLLGRTDFELFPHDLANRYRAGDDEVLATGRTLEAVERYTDTRGEQRWTRVIKSPVYDAQRAVVGVQILASDVTARQQAEEALANSRTELEARHGELQQSQLRLRQQTELLQSILASLADGVVVGDPAGRLMAWNPAAESLLGTPPGEAPIREWPGIFGLYLPDAQTPHPS